MGCGSGLAGRLVIGVAVFGQRFRGGAPDLAAEVPGRALIAAAAAGLTRPGPR